MKKVEIEVNGEVFPCRPTMGAMLRFKHETGKEVTEINEHNISELCTYLWCCVASASKHDGKNFNSSLIDFADSISLEDMTEWAQSVKSDTDAAVPEEDEKKS